ncbi:GAF domain-containing hybrid sensor histidine kinase/response regulator [Brevundimonas goettingensis]|uniref:histidine kinase n=1 Tax=Brevundimonas goettingensis TaxID=2774190 RepID=A0A975C0J0_9CAUL|nr:GAF domain-containing hybrid sensor histidine kinase/response regulator [Brevundimonas goettingensis]QTC90124.1 response regulator [Brevundimonas goettingensis]
MSSEAERLAHLHSFNIVGAPANPVLDAAARLAAKLFSCPITAVTLIDEDTQWLAARTGLDLCSTSREDAFCAVTIQRPPRAVMVVENAATDPRFRDNPLVTGEPGIRFYAGAALTTSDGFNLGALCVIDTVARPRPSDEALAELRDLADLAVAELERLRAERGLREREQVLDMAEAMSGVGHWKCDLKTGALLWSDEVFTICGMDRATFKPVLGRSIHLYDAEDQTILTAAIEATTLGKGPFHLELGLNRPDGQKRRVMAKGDCQFDREGRPISLFGVFQDVTEQRAAIVAAEQAAAVKSEFLANMSHELRTPLTSIVGFTDLAAEQPDLSPVMRDYVRRIDNAGRALLCTVNDILDFSKLEAGQVAIRPEPTDLEDLCRSTLELFSPQAGAKDLTLDFRMGSVSSALVPALMIDPDRVRQVLLNLIGNAVKFTATGGVTVVAAWDPRTQRLGVSVADTGAGIPAHKLGLLFQRFSQIDGSSTRGAGGTGLGLAICKGLCEAMGGTVGADSVEGRGSRFWFEIDAQAANAALEVASPAEIIQLSALTGSRVLIADDHPANRELARLFLSGLGAEVIEVEDGAAAVDRLSAETFDLVLMDLRMPRMDGREALKAVRANIALANDTPILAYTADGDGDTSLLMAAGFAGVVPKPLVPADFFRTVSRALYGAAMKRAA